MNLIFGVQILILGLVLTINFGTHGNYIVLPFTMGLMVLGMYLLTKSKHIMKEISEDEKRVAEYFLSEHHFSEKEKKLLCSVANSSHFISDEKERFDELVRLHKFLLN